MEGKCNQGFKIISFCGSFILICNSLHEETLFLKCAMKLISIEILHNVCSETERQKLNSLSC